MSKGNTNQVSYGEPCLIYWPIYQSIYVGCHSIDTRPIHRSAITKSRSTAHQYTGQTPVNISRYIDRDIIGSPLASTNMLPISQWNINATWLTLNRQVIHILVITQSTHDGVTTSISTNILIEAHTRIRHSTDMTVHWNSVGWPIYWSIYCQI